MNKIPGVESVNVSLNHALVSIELKPGNSVRLDQIRKAILDDAFTPKEATVTVVGQVVQNSGQPALKVTGTDQLYELAPVSPKATNAFRGLSSEQGKTVIVQGVVPEPPKDGKAKPRLLVESFSNGS
ncbi:MAG: heavy-metal-associated domain-containing protein [Candidatus Binataceae bacterium]